MKILYLLPFTCTLLFSNALQDAIDKAPENSKLELDSGKYFGNIVINKPIILEGKDKTAHIIGDNTTHVIIINSSNVIIRNLSISGSGSSHERIDSGILAKNVNNIEISNNNITDALFGIDLQQVSNSKVVGNYISSKDFDLGIRGDGIRLWASSNNIIAKNNFYKSRDLVAWYSSKNIFEGNYAEGGRYSLHFMYANDNIIRDNIFKHNSVGIFFMYSKNIEAYNNIVQSSSGAFGIGIGLKDCTDFNIRENSIIYNARGVYLDQSPYQQGDINEFRNNKILYNSSAVQFQGLRENVLFEDNIFKGNMEIILSDTPKDDAKYITWNGNFWDTYEGYDKDRDGIGDIEYFHYAYADRLWQYNPNIKFFYGSVTMDLLNFLAKMAPFSEPELLAVDKKPRMKDKF
ncbi:MAG: nitrous oxide reductase family maturation protein NosD [Campylobacteraceae bacterium]